jgi:hypothetical protein
MFTMRGKITQLEKPADFQVTWDSGKLVVDSGLNSFMAIAMMEAHSLYASVGLGGGPYWTGDSIFEVDLAVYLLAYEMFDSVEIIAGEILTKVPDIPDGAIA